MRLFNVQERESTKEIIIEDLKNIKGIVSIILVGSGADGFTDELSDLDLTIAIDNDLDISVIMNEVNKLICSKFDVMNSLQIEKRGLAVYTLRNFLEIDIGYVKFEKLSALRGKWLVLYDKTNKADTIMKQTWEINKNNHGKKESVNIEQAYDSAAGDIYHYIIHSITAVKRKKYFRAIGEIDILRNKLIELLGYKYSLETKRYRDVDMFPSEVKNKLEKTMITKLDIDSLKNTINLLTDIIYDELESFYDEENDKIKVTRNDIRDYMKEVLGD